MPPCASYATTCFLESTPACPSFSERAYGSGSGCRPLVPVFGDERSSSRCRKRAPGMCDAAYILVEMQKTCAGDVRCRILGTSARRIGQIVPTIEHDPIRIGEMLREDFGADERGEDHAAILPAAGTEKL